MAKFFYRFFLLLAIAAAVWGGVHYIMGVRSGKQLENGVELVRSMEETETIQDRAERNYVDLCSTSVGAEQRQETVCHG